MASKKLIKQWVKDRDEAVLSFDLEKFKAFYRKYQGLGERNDKEGEAGARKS